MVEILRVDYPSPSCLWAIMFNHCLTAPSSMPTFPAPLQPSQTLSNPCQPPPPPCNPFKPMPTSPMQPSQTHATPLKPMQPLSNPCTVFQAEKNAEKFAVFARKAELDARCQALEQQLQTTQLSAFRQEVKNR